MTSSRDGSSRWFSWTRAALLLFWGTTAVVSLVNQGFENRPYTTPGSPIAEGLFNDTNNTSYEEFNASACGDKVPICPALCEFCHGSHQMTCLSALIQHICASDFHKAMESHNSTNWCVWSNVRSPYNNFTLCTEQIAECLRIPWPNVMVEGIFLQIHADYFQDCPTEELSDPPPSIVFALVMTPICLIPVMVVLVVLKTKNGDGSS